MIAIRGAVQVERNSAAAISTAVAALCAEIARANRLGPSQIVSALFTLTPDLSADFPARAAREAGWTDVPMICAQEIPVPGAAPRVCRVLVHARGRARPRHVYMGAASTLRRDSERAASSSDSGRRRRGRKRTGAGARSRETP